MMLLKCNEDENKLFALPSYLRFEMKDGQHYSNPSMREAFRALQLTKIRILDF